MSFCEVIKDALFHGRKSYNCCVAEIEREVARTSLIKVSKDISAANEMVFGKNGLAEQIRKLKSAEEAVNWFNERMEKTTQGHKIKNRIAQSFLRGSAYGLELYSPSFLKLWMDSNNGNVFFVPKAEKLTNMPKRANPMMPLTKDLIRVMKKHAGINQPKI